VYPVVVDQVCHDWELDPPGETDGPTGSVRPVPANGLPRPHLVEAPFVLDRCPGTVDLTTAPAPVSMGHPGHGRPHRPEGQPATTS
jgi:hypothetical protein